MADDFVQAAPDSTGKKVRTFLHTVGGNPVESQANGLIDPVSGNPITAPNTAPVGTEQGMITRPIPMALASATNLLAKNSTGVGIQTQPGMWSVTATATAGTPSASKAAGAAGVSHVCTTVSVSLACGTTPQTPVTVNLRDGATGVGTVLMSWTLAALAGDAKMLSLTGLNLPGTAATAMTLELAGATATNVVATVNLAGYDCQ